MSPLAWWSHVIALLSAVLALAAAGWAAILGGRGKNSGPNGAVGVFRRIALSAATISGVLLVVLITKRVIVHALEIQHGDRLPASIKLGLRPEGLLAMAALAGACGLLLRSTRRLRLISPLFWISVLTVFWVALLVPAYVPAQDGIGIVRSAASVLLAIGLSVVLAGFVVAQGVNGQRFRWGALLTRPDRLIEHPPHWPGFRISAGVIGVIMVLLGCYHFAVPAELGSLGYRATALIMTTVSVVAGAALFALVGRRWNEDLADAAMGLVTVAACSAALVFLPPKPATLDERYPLIFNAVVIALAIMSGLWGWLSAFWQQQLDGPSGRPWTCAGYLVQPATRFSFLSASTGILVAFLMSVWPRIPTVAATDDTLARFAGGLSAYLLLILALLQNVQRRRRRSVLALTALCVMGMIGFIVVRVAPYSSANH